MSMHPCIHYGSKGQEKMGRDIVQSYILGHNFTKIPANVNVRPPAIGEEHDVISVGGRSSHSSVSGKSELSTATPRRTDMDLGYEPEGSASPLPAHERWKLSLFNMLHDSEGFAAFTAYLSKLNEESILECWLAMKGFRDFDRPRSSGNSSAASSTTGSLSNKSNQASEQKSAQKMKLAKIIYKTYLASNSLKCVSTIKNATKQYILKQIKDAVNSENGGYLDPELFLPAQNEIERNVEDNSYKGFLASSDFSKYAAQCDSTSAKVSTTLTPQSNLSQSPRSSETSSGESPNDQNVTQPQTGSSVPYLPRLDENQVWSPPAQNRPSSGSPHTSNAQLTSDSLAKTAMHRAMFSNQAFFERGSFPHSRDQVSDASPYFTPGNPYWVPPASAIGSDQASKSSDATSDTLSCTDNSSVDGMAPYSSSRSGQKRLVRSQIKKNPANALPECKEHVQRTSRMKDIPDLAAKNPRAFFEQLRFKLLKVLEEQKMRHKKLGAPQRSRMMPIPSTAPVPAGAAGSSILGEEEDLDAMMDTHLKRVISSPGGRYSPPLASGKRPQQPPLNPSNDAFYSQQKNPAYLGIVPVMPQNEVPDVQTPVIPVDKNQMINAWIQMRPQQIKNKKIQKKGRCVGPPMGPSSEGGVHFVHPAGSTGLQSGSSSRKLQPLAQDPTMPPFDLPDAGTTIEEVKRRLMEETDESYDDFAALESLKIGDAPFASLPPTSGHALPYNASVSQTTSSSSKPQPPSDNLPSNPVEDHPSSSDTDSSSETATLSNVNKSSAPTTQQKPATEGSTTVVYYMPHEPVPYRVKIPHQPLTLGQFKMALSKKGNFKYFFKQQSVELQRPVYFEVSKDYEQLPYWEGNVVAKIDPYAA